MSISISSFDGRLAFITALNQSFYSFNILMRDFISHTESRVRAPHPNSEISSRSL